MAGDLGAYWKSIERGPDFHVQAIVREPRHAAIDHAQDAVRRCRGDVRDFKAFSDLSLTLIVALRGRAVHALLDELRARANCAARGSGLTARPR